MVTTVVTTKGQVVIPARIRRKLNIKKGTRLYIEEKGDEVVLKPVTPAYLDKIAGVLQTEGRLSKALLKERARDRRRGA
ncbi:MAG: AbrB/MazE/SpoVT family DNA-binding domain-containing protein [Chloroflexi bacterium]|nr:AbrB/MazE/SpoVT family DNA-binding domain-containing protein [Chloroflexota bacterium]